ncbi:MAG: tRNA (adenosine(37)-N6)-threonylcarbamoyltransferase complex transferase subunit TsaD, partial [Bacilli bacterium]
MKDEIILAIESSCDETAVSILKNGKELLVNTVNTQIADHQRFGGVYPELASRLHLKNITKVVSYALSLKGFDYHSITHVAVTGGPGLPGALQIGNMAAKTISQYLNVPLIS